MDSRIRANPKTIFDCFLEVVPSKTDSDQPWILQTFPASFKDKEPETLRDVPQFAFPCRLSITNVEHFSFVLTNLEAKWTFGFCRYAPSGETALVFLSSLPWHEFFYKLLNVVAEQLQLKDSGLLWRFLEQVYKSPVPPGGLPFHLVYGQDQVFSSPTPNLLNLPSIPENRNLTEYYNAVDVNNMLIIFASMLYERRIIVTSKKLSRLSACVQAANSIIYPMSWQHIFIPVLPVKLMDYLCAPMPFLIGVPEMIMKRTRPSELGDVVILDADNNRVETSFLDLESLPNEVVSNLRKTLKTPANLLGDSVARAFLQALVHLIGGYRDALKCRQGEKITFNEDAFILSRSSSLQPFLEKMLSLQIFRQFIEERLELLNSGKGFSDEFEIECVAFTEKTNKKFKNQYTAMTQNVKKEGGAFVKKVKNKANPAVKDAMKNVLDGSKIAKDKVKDGGKLARTKAKATFKDVKSRLKDNREEMKDDASSVHSAPSSPVQSRSSVTINRYGTMSSAQFPRQNTDLGFGRVLKYERFDPFTEPEENLSPDLEELPRLDMELMSDLQEIFKNKMEGKLIGSTTMNPAVSRNPTAAVAVESVQSSRKSSVGDLINLDNDSDSLNFDPLAAPSSSKPETNMVGNHRKLSRTSIPGSAPLLGNSSVGKYENYQPPGGPNQEEFKQFLSSMTDQKQGQNRSSEDLLREYGLNFSKMSMHNPHPSNPSLLNYQPGGFQSSTHATQYNNVNNNGIISSSASSYVRPNYQTNGGVVGGGSKAYPHNGGVVGGGSAAYSHNGGGVGGGSAPYPHNGGGVGGGSAAYPHNVGGSAAYPHNGGLVGGGSAAYPPPQQRAPSVPSRPNSSFLYNSAVGNSSNFVPPDSTVMPVNQRLLLSSEGGLSQVPSCKDILAELDPLRKPSLERSNLASVNPMDLDPPAVPPRSKKQWTTFD